MICNRNTTISGRFSVVHGLPISLPIDHTTVASIIALVLLHLAGGYILYPHPSAKLLKYLSLTAGTIVQSSSPAGAVRCIPALIIEG